MAQVEHGNKILKEEEEESEAIAYRLSRAFTWMIIT